MFYRPLCGVGGHCQSLAGDGDRCDFWNNRGRNAVTGGLPPRSVREELPHTDPALSRLQPETLHLFDKTIDANAAKWHTTPIPAYGREASF